MPTQITIDRFTNILREYPVKQAPLAARFIINQMAFEGRRVALKIVAQKFILRNRFTQNRIQFDTAAPTRDLSRLKSAFGALKSIEYMADMEKGYTNRPKQGSKLPVPTRAARIGTNIGRRKRAAFRHDRMGTMRKISGYKGRGKRQKIQAMLQDMARTRDKKPAVVPFSRKPGVYVVRNIRRRKMGSKATYDFKMVKLYDLSRRSVYVRPRPWMKFATMWVVKKEAKLAEQAWRRFLSRIR